MKTCSICDETKELSEFNKRGSDCKICHRIKMNQHYAENKAYYKAKSKAWDQQKREENRLKLINYLLEHSCIDCNNTDIEVLQFDHINPNEKLFSIATMLCKTWDTIEIELKKCEVRCANCHIKRTRRQFGYWTHNMPL